MKLTKYLVFAALSANLFTFPAFANNLETATNEIKKDVEIQLAQVRADIDASVNQTELTANISKLEIELHARELISMAKSDLPETRFKVVIAD